MKKIYILFSYFIKHFLLFFNQRLFCFFIQSQKMLQFLYRLFQFYYFSPLQLIYSLQSQSDRLSFNFFQMFLEGFRQIYFKGNLHEKEKQKQGNNFMHKPINGIQNCKGRTNRVNSSILAEKTRATDKMLKIQGQRKLNLLKIHSHEPQQQVIQRREILTIQARITSNFAKKQDQRVIIGKATFDNTIKQKTLTKRMHDALQLSTWNTNFQKYQKWKPIFDSMTRSQAKQLKMSNQRNSTILKEINHIAFTNLKLLDLSKNKLTNIEALLFMNCENLQSLNIKGANRLITLKILKKAIHNQKFGWLSYKQKKHQFIFDSLQLSRIRFDNQVKIMKRVQKKDFHMFPRQIDYLHIK